MSVTRGNIIKFSSIHPASKMKRKVQAQRKFAAGAYIPPSASANPPADRRPETTHKDDVRNVIYNNLSPDILLDYVSFQHIHKKHQQPVVVLERMGSIQMPLSGKERRLPSPPGSEQTDEDDNRPLNYIAEMLRAPRKTRKRRNISHATAVTNGSVRSLSPVVCLSKIKPDRRGLRRSTRHQPSSAVCKPQKSHKEVPIVQKQGRKRPGPSDTLKLGPAIKKSSTGIKTSVPLRRSRRNKRADLISKRTSATCKTTAKINLSKQPVEGNASSNIKKELLHSPVEVECVDQKFLTDFKLKNSAEMVKTWLKGKNKPPRDMERDRVKFKVPRVPPLRTDGKCKPETRNSTTPLTELESKPAEADVADCQPSHRSTIPNRATPAISETTTLPSLSQDRPQQQQQDTTADPASPMDCAVTSASSGTRAGSDACVSRQLVTVQSIVEADEDELSSRCSNCAPCLRVDKVREFSCLVQEHACNGVDDIYEFRTDRDDLQECPRLGQFRTKRANFDPPATVSPEIAPGTSGTPVESVSDILPDHYPKYLDLFPQNQQLIVEITSIERQGKRMLKARLVPRSDATVVDEISLNEQANLVEQLFAHWKDGMITDAQFQPQAQTQVLSERLGQPQVKIERLQQPQIQPLPLPKMNSLSQDSFSEDLTQSKPLTQTKIKPQRKPLLQMKFKPQRKLLPSKSKRRLQPRVDPEPPSDQQVKQELSHQVKQGKVLVTPVDVSLLQNELKMHQHLSQLQHAQLPQQQVQLQHLAQPHVQLQQLSQPQLQAQVQLQSLQQLKTSPQIQLQSQVQGLQFGTLQQPVSQPQIQPIPQPNQSQMHLQLRPLPQPVSQSNQQVQLQQLPPAQMHVLRSLQSSQQQLVQLPAMSQPQALVQLQSRPMLLEVQSQPRPLVQLVQLQSLPHVQLQSPPQPDLQPQPESQPDPPVQKNPELVLPPESQLEVSTEQVPQPGQQKPQPEPQPPEPRPSTSRMSTRRSNQSAAQVPTKRRKNSSFSAASLSPSITNANEATSAVPGPSKASGKEVSALLLGPRKSTEKDELAPIPGPSKHPEKDVSAPLPGPSECTGHDVSAPLPGPSEFTGNEDSAPIQGPSNCNDNDDLSLLPEPSDCAGSDVSEPVSVPSDSTRNNVTAPPPANQTKETYLVPKHEYDCFMTAPVFHPTEEEFTDPLIFFEKILPTVSKYGICKVVAPASFRATCTVAEEVRFSVSNQYLSRLYCRWGAASREMCAIKSYLAQQKVFFTRPPLIDGMELNLPKLYRTVQKHGGLKKVIEKKRWGRVAEDMRFQRGPRSAHRIDQLYVKHLLPYDTLSNEERCDLLKKVDITWNRNYMQMVSRACNPLHRQKQLLEESSSSSEDSESDDEGSLEKDAHLAVAIAEAEDCVVVGRHMKLSVFKKVAENVMYTLFSQPEPTPEQVEQKYWQLVGSAEEHVCVNSASIDTGEEGYGFTKSYKHPWNLKMLSQNSGNVLRSLGPVLGVTVPTLHLGMVLSTSCWHRDPHGLPWVEYLHDGPAKIWYGIPDELSSTFRVAVEELCPTACQNKSIWLPSDITMIPPLKLAEHGVPLSRVVQRPGEFIVVLPKAYSSSISTGYTQSESVYFATKSWLNDVSEVFKELSDSCEPTMFSLEQLVLAVALDHRSDDDVLREVQPILTEITDQEMSLRKALWNHGAVFIIPETPRINFNRLKKPSGAWNVREQDECDICRTTLYLSKVTGLTNKGSTFCLRHALILIEKCQEDAEGVVVTTYVVEADFDFALSRIKYKLRTDLAADQNDNEDDDDDGQNMVLRLEEDSD